MTGCRILPSLELVREVAEHYGLGDVLSYGDVGGSTTTNLRLETAHLSLLARIHPAGASLDRIVAMQAVRIALANAGLPTVRPLPSPGGDTIVVLAGGALAELEPFIEFDAIMNTVPALIAGHQLLARIHDTLRGLDAPAAAAGVAQANYISTRDAVAACRRGADRVHGWADRGLTALADALLDHVEQVTSAEERFQSGQITQLVHGDFWDNNVLFSGAEITAVIDFGFMSRRHRIDDLALTAYYILLEPGTGLPGPAERSHIRSFLDAYDAHSELPLSSVERLALPLAIARQPAWSLGGWVLDLPEPAAVRHARMVAAELPVAAAVLKDLAPWQEALS